MRKLSQRADYIRRKEWEEPEHFHRQSKKEEWDKIVRRTALLIIIAVIGGLYLIGWFFEHQFG